MQIAWLGAIGAALCMQTTERSNASVPWHLEPVHVTSPPIEKNTFAMRASMPVQGIERRTKIKSVGRDCAAVGWVTTPAMAGVVTERQD
jgi:hypothetical protein